MTIFGGSPDDPVSGQTPADTLGNDSPIDLADDDHVQDPNLGGQGSRAPEAVRGSAGLATGGLEEDPLG